MSKVWTSGNGWRDTQLDAATTASPVKKTVVPPTPPPSPDSYQEMRKQGIADQERMDAALKVLYLPENWILVSYWIKGDALRSSFRMFVKKHGLQSLELMPGSVYVGPTNQKLDDGLRQRAEEIKKKANGSCSITVLPGVYAQDEARLLASRVVQNALADLKAQEDAVIAVEASLTNGTVLKNEDGKELDLLTSGYGRLAALEEAIDGADGVLNRFEGSAALVKVAERLALRVRQVRTWEQTVKRHYERWAAVERRKRKADGAAKGNEGVA